jgi:uncharacterized protein YuzE
MKLRVSYDQQADVLYLAREGHEARVEEVYPGVQLEFDAEGQLIGVEVLQASQVLKEVAEPLLRRAGSSPAP